jgi:hypothetical protein
MGKKIKIKKSNVDNEKEKVEIEEPKVEEAKEEKTENEPANKKLVKRKNRSGEYPVLEPDWYKGEIVDANLEEYPSDYNKSGMREVIEIDISIIAEDGTEVIVKRFDNLNYHDMSNLSDTLRELNIDKPDVEGYLDLNEFIGKKLEVRVGNKNKNGRTYNTVEAIKGL